MIREKIKKYNLTLTDVAELFGYSSSVAMRNSTAYEKRLKALEKLINHIEKELINRIQQ